MIVWHDDLLKQGPVLCTSGNDKAAAYIGSLVDWILIHVLKQGVAYAGACAHPWRTGCCVEVILVLHIIIVHSGVHQAIWRVDGDGHDTPIIGNEQGI